MKILGTCILIFFASVIAPAFAQGISNQFPVSDSCQRNVFSCTPYERVILDYQRAERRKESQAAESVEIEKFCNLVAEKIRMCDPLRNWRPIITDFQVDQQYHNEDGINAQISSSDGGLYQGLSGDSAAAAVIKMAQRSPIVREFRLLSSEIGGSESMPKRVLIYSGRIEDIPFTYINTIVVGKTRNVQIITFEIGAVPSDKGRIAHTEFVDTIRLADGF